MSKGCARNLKKECAGRAAGPVVCIGEKKATLWLPLTYAFYCEAREGIVSLRRIPSGSEPQMPFIAGGHREIGKHEWPSFSHLHEAQLAFSGRGNRKRVCGSGTKGLLIPKDHDRRLRHAPGSSFARHPAHERGIIVVVLPRKFRGKTIPSLDLFH